MTAVLRDALDRIERALRTQGMPFAEHLGPPADGPEVIARLAELGLAAPRDVVEVFTWHNGYAASTAQIPGGWEITPRGATPISLDEAVRLYLKGPGDVSVPETAAPEWFPVFRYGTGVVAIRCDSATREPTGARLWDTWPHAGPIHRSLAEPLSWWAEWLEAGQWRWTPNGWIDDRDDTQMTSLQRESSLT